MILPRASTHLSPAVCHRGRSGLDGAGDAGWHEGSSRRDGKCVPQRLLPASDTRESDDRQRRPAVTGNGRHGRRQGSVVVQRRFGRRQNNGRPVAGPAADSFFFSF